MLEIERKFLIKNLPENLEAFPKFEIVQWYIKDEEWNKCRIRKKWEKYYKTYKKWTWLVREEIETEINQSEFETQRTSVGERFLTKTRYEIPYGKYKIELDIFKDKLQWLIYAEVEFPSAEEAQDFVVPLWFGIELTEIKEASNGYLAKHWISERLKELMNK